ncbi:conserved hypothetical protein [Ricinus communis]|uniref:Uncharacterized protein n=1 Tax=Ricinus communis TaxID=3988 RepID=B9TEJ2_RICCO|nr:conserved hypothetical protein [Ricinus communis]
MSVNTGSHSPNAGCRKRRTDSYQGESERSLSQRQSALNGMRIHVFMPSAPARCAIAVSTVTSTSMLCNADAVSVRSLNWSVRSRTLLFQGMAESSARRSPFWKLMRATSSRSASLLKSER